MEQGRLELTSSLSWRRQTHNRTMCKVSLVWLGRGVGLIRLYTVLNPSDHRDDNDGWIRYMKGLQLGLIDSGMHSLSVLLETSHRTWRALEIAQGASAGIISRRVRALRILAMATIWGQRLFCSDLPIVRLLLEGSVYLRAVSIWGQRLFEGSVYLRAAPIWGQRLIEEIRYVPLLDGIHGKNFLNTLNYYYTHQERGCLGQCEASFSYCSCKHGLCVLFVHIIQYTCSLQLWFAFLNSTHWQHSSV